MLNNCEGERINGPGHTSMSADLADLSRLKIHREERSSSGPPSRPRSWLLIYAAGAIFLALGLFFFLRDSFTPDPLVEVTAVSYISPAQASALLTASGYVVAQRKAAIASKATGRLVYLGYQEGDRVKKGQIIARIESADVEAALAQAKADLEVARADLHDAQQSLDRTTELFGRKLASQADYDAAKARYDRVVATIALKKAGLASAEVAVENTRIRAPFDGTILTKNADIGEVVAPFAAGASSRVAVVTIADMTSLEVEADVAESNIERVTVGSPCEISLDAYPESHYRGAVDKIVPTADRAKATVLTKVRFLERDSRVLPEMSAKVHFLPKQSPQGEDAAPKLVVDTGAVIRVGGNAVVYRLVEGRAAEAPVELGERFAGVVEIRGGLAAGDKVVLRPPQKLSAGMKVRIKE